MEQRDKAKIDLVRQWLEKAEKDFNLAHHLAAERHSYREAIAFHSQQAPEKLLKGFLVFHQVEFPKTHNLASCWTSWPPAIQPWLSSSQISPPSIRTEWSIVIRVTADCLTGQTSAEIDLLAIQAEAATVGDDNGLVVKRILWLAEKPLSLRLHLGTV